MRARGSLPIPEALEDVCDPAALAVIVYDMQMGVLEQLPDGAEAVKRVERVLGGPGAGRLLVPAGQPGIPDSSRPFPGSG